MNILQVCLIFAIFCEGYKCHQLSTAFKAIIVRMLPIKLPNINRSDNVAINNFTITKINLTDIEIDNTVDKVTKFVVNNADMNVEGVATVWKFIWPAGEQNFSGNFTVEMKGIKAALIVHTDDNYSLKLGEDVFPYCPTVASMSVQLKDTVFSKWYLGWGAINNIIELVIESRKEKILKQICGELQKKLKDFDLSNFGNVKFPQ